MQVEGRGGRRGRRAAAADDAAVAQAATATARAAHEATLRRLGVLDAPLAAGHALRKEATAIKQTSSSAKARMKAVVTQVSSLNKSLPAQWHSSVHVAVDEDRPDMLRVLILPDEDTPYANGAFLFDAFLPANFPTASPKMTFLTTGGGRVRFNPNLYNCGKVCLSLLGTWAGPGWEPGTSTLLQVLISLQAMVFCPQPFFNEPGYARMEGTKQGDTETERYNANIRAHTVQLAILDPLLAPAAHPHGVFAEVLAAHWRAKREVIIAQMAAWRTPAALAQKVTAALHALN